MKAITITADFSGYPDGETERVFRTGDEPEDLADDYAEILITKGLAEEKAQAPAAPARGGFLPPASPAPQPTPEPTKAAAETKDDAK